jgi:tetratricopeptide (TPR) repeat protein
MLETHLSLEDFEGFLKEGARPARPDHNARILRHLLRDCAICHDRLSTFDASQRLPSQLFSLREPAGDELPTSAAAQGYDYSRAFAIAERSVSAFLASDDAQADGAVEPLLASLSGLSEREQAERVSAWGALSRPPVIRALIERSHLSRYRDAQKMLHFATLAKLASEQSPEVSGESGGMKGADLLTRVWGQYGSALRVCGRPHEAHQALARAQEHRLLGTGDPALRAWLLEKLTALAVAQERLDDAVELAEEGGEIYQDLGDSHAFASTQIHKAVALIYSGETEGALRTLHQAIPLIEYAEDPYLLLAACHNLIRCYIDLDRPDQALMLYSEIREIYQDFDDPLILLKTAWQEGKLLCDLGHLRAAETALLRARKGYMEKGIASEMALVSLDLATVYVKLGLVDEVKRTVITTLPIFHALRVKLDTLAALLQLQQVADQEQQALELVRALSSRIESLPKKNAAR